MSGKKNSSAWTLSRRDLLKLGATVGIASTVKPTFADDLNTTFCPASGTRGDLITAIGPDYSIYDLKNLSTRIVADNAMAFARPARVGQDLIFQLMGLPPAVFNGNLEIAEGIGALSLPDNLPVSLSLEGPVKTWMGTRGTCIRGNQPFVFPWTTEVPCLTFWGGLDNFGRLNIDIAVPCDRYGCPQTPAQSVFTLRAYAKTVGDAL